MCIREFYLSIPGKETPRPAGDYAYRIKKGQIRLVTGDDLTDYPTPTPEELAAYREAVRARTPKLEGFTVRLTPDHVLLERLISGGPRGLGPRCGV
jgi:glycine/D-amino acid oxidase-like deaminating enzyme